MEDIKKQIVDRLKEASNILVTVRNNPTVDLLSACIGLALVLDKMDKHAAAVFSGQIPSTIEFLQPETTIEQTPDSLRDFIIALDKSKADKLRYKVEDKVVRIFITPYKTSLSEKDLEFSQGDFNVEAVIALGAHEQQELDQAITTHGRILHDATLISINNTPDGNLGALNWLEIGASSISEMVTELAMDLHKDAFDQQIATALLTGIVAETERFSNDKTTPRTMNLAGQLMASGANQQLVATSLQQPASSPVVPIAVDDRGDTATPAPLPMSEPEASNPPKDDGTLAITHNQQEDEVPSAEPAPMSEEHTPELPEETDGSAPMIPPRDVLPTPEPVRPEETYTSPLLETPSMPQYEETPLPPRSYLTDRRVIAPVSPLPIPPEPSNVNPTDVPSVELPTPVLTHESTTPPVTSDAPIPLPVPSPPPMMPGSIPSAPAASQTLDALEKATGSFHQADAAPTAVPPIVSGDNSVDAARGQVLNAFQSEDISQPTSRRVDLNAAPLGGSLHPHTDDSQAATQPEQPTVATIDHVSIDPEGNLSPNQPGVAAPTPLPNAPADPSVGTPSLPQAPTAPPPITLFRP